MERCRNAGALDRGEGEFSEKTRRPAASSGTILTSGNPDLLSRSKSERGLEARLPPRPDDVRTVRLCVKREAKGPTYTICSTRKVWRERTSNRLQQQQWCGVMRGKLRFAHLPDWSAQSPDLNPIEHLSDELDHRVRARQARPKSIAQLMEWLQEEWRRIPVDVLQTLVESMRDRVAAVIAARGTFLSSFIFSYAENEVELAEWGCRKSEESNHSRGLQFGFYARASVASFRFIQFLLPSAAPSPSVRVVCVFPEPRRGAQLCSPRAESPGADQYRRPWWQVERCAGGQDGGRESGRGLGAVAVDRIDQVWRGVGVRLFPRRCSCAVRRPGAHSTAAMLPPLNNAFPPPPPLHKFARAPTSQHPFHPPPTFAAPAVAPTAERRRNARTGKGGTSQRKARLPAASTGTIPTCENPETRPRIEPGSPWWEAGRLTDQPPWPPVTPPWAHTWLGRVVASWLSGGWSTQTSPVARFVGTSKKKGRRASLMCRVLVPS
ncbi:hypothetical protein PR048_033638 [Dryococelus australis]|uniref:Tc1-like transposase DDE domain-containing protein n=1 Tax=Dryococelus australis TaxID=614101 RepID=A0ABQ9G4Z2_9NEOP|nr:hypothetical protein PR048_033638 [Dryococelus australis]